MKQTIGISLLRFVLWTLPLLGHAESWVGSSSGSWGDGANWESGSVPEEGARSVFASDAEVTLDGNQRIGGLTVTEDATGGVTVSAGAEESELTLMDSSGLFVKEGAGPLTVGGGGSAGMVRLVVGPLKQGQSSQNWTNRSDFVVRLWDGVRGESSNNKLRLWGDYLLGDSCVKGGIESVEGSLEMMGRVEEESGMLQLRSSFVSDTAPVDVNSLVLVEQSFSAFRGEAPMRFHGGANGLAFSFAQYANPVFRLLRSAPVVLDGTLSLCNSGQWANNNAVSFSCDSGARLELLGTIQNCNGGYAQNLEGRGLTLRFYGVGNEVVIAGENHQGSATGAGVSLSPSAQAVYNGLILDGAGQDISPFGDSYLYSNEGNPVFLKVQEEGKRIVNSFSFGASSMNGRAAPIGIDGEYGMEFLGDFTYPKGWNPHKFPIRAKGETVFSGTISAGTLYMIGVGDRRVSNSGCIAGVEPQIRSVGGGSLTLQGGFASENGALGVFGGRLVLDYTLNDAPHLPPTNRAEKLSFGGADVVLRGGTTAESVGEGSSTLFAQGATRIRREGGSSTLDIGAIVRSTGDLAKGRGATLDVSAGVVRTRAGNTAGILLGQGFVTVDGADFAMVDSNGWIRAVEASGYTPYGTSMSSDSLSLLEGDATLSGTTHCGNLKIAPTAPNQKMTIYGNPVLCLDRGGLLFTGPYDYSIGAEGTGGSVRGINSYGSASFVHQYGTGTLTIGATVTGYDFVKSGPGKLVLAGGNSLSMGMHLLEGILETPAAEALGTRSTLFLNGGTWRPTSSFTVDRPISLGHSGGVVDVPEGVETTLTGAFSNTRDGFCGPFKKRGQGRLVVDSVGSSDGPVIVEQGTLALANVEAFGCSTNNARCYMTMEVEEGGSLDVVGNGIYLGNVTLSGGDIVDSSEELTGTFGAYTLYAESGRMEVPFMDVVLPNTPVVRNASNVIKTTEGEVVMAAGSWATGAHFVRAGRLAVEGDVEGSVYAIGGEFAGCGTVARHVAVQEGGRLVPEKASGEPANLVLQKSLSIENGTLCIPMDRSTYGTVELTNPDACVVLDGASLAISRRKGTGGFFYEPKVILKVAGDHPIRGEFVGYPNGAHVKAADGHEYVLNYFGGDGNDLELQEIPLATILFLR